MEVKTPFMIDVEHRIALHAMQGNQASFCGEWEVSRFFLRCFGKLGYILELKQGCAFKTRVFSAMSGLLSSCEGHLGILLKAWQGNREDPQGEA